MAASFDAATAYDLSGNPGTSHTWTHVAGASSTVIIISGSTGGQTLSAVTYSGDSCTVENSQATNRAFQAYKAGNATGSNTCSVTIGSSDTFSGGATTFNGTLTTSAVVGATNTGQENPASSPASIAVTTTSTDNIIHATISAGANSTDFTPSGTDQTNRYECATTNRNEGDTQVATNASDTASWTWSVAPNQVYMCAFEVVSAFDSSSWSNYFEITSDNTKVAEAVTDLLYDLADAPAGFWSTVDSTGKDIRITDSTGTTAYAFELENFASGSSTGILFFNSVGLATGSDTTYRIYYGNSGVSAPADADALGRENVWSASYNSVYHMAEDPSGSAPQLVDSTSNRNDATSAGTMTSGDLVNGKIGKAIDFDDSNDKFTVPDGQQVGNTNTFTIMLWVSVDSGQDGYIYSEGNSGDNNPFNSFLTNGSGNILQSARATGGGSIGGASGTTDLRGAGFKMVTGVRRAADDWEVYVGSSSEGTNATSVGSMTLDKARIGCEGLVADGSFMGGQIDELRIINTNVSDNWITTTFNNQDNPATFWTTGAEQPITFIAKMITY